MPGIARRHKSFQSTFSAIAWLSPDIGAGDDLDGMYAGRSGRRRHTGCYEHRGRDDPETATKGTIDQLGYEADSNEGEKNRFHFHWHVLAGWAICSKIARLRSNQPSLWQEFAGLELSDTWDYVESLMNVKALLCPWL